MLIGTSQRTLRFRGFELDLARYTIRRGANEVSLRPKTFDVLRYLAERAGQVVTKDELFEAVWPETTVTDDSLVQCVMEIRQALDDGKRQLLKTLPKRGYVLNAHAVEDSACPAVRREDISAPAMQDMPLEERPGSQPWHVALPASWHRLALAIGLTVAVLSLTGSAALHPRSGPPNANATHFAILGTTLLDRERTANVNREALTLFDKALAIDPDHGLALVGYARVLITDVTEGWAPPQERVPRLAQAEAALDHALKVDANNPRAHHVSGLLWRARGEPERAIPALEQALRLTPTKAWARADLGRAHLEAGKAREAIKDLEIAMRLSPDEPAIFIWYFQAGMAAVHAGDHELALTWLQKSEERSPIYRRHVLLWRAIALGALGREAEGRAVMAQYLADAPDFSIASWKRTFPWRNAAVAAQRERIATVLRRLGLTEGDVKTGSIQ
jgi:DNA-binding winged helix-turn-helix (wHTH) protein/tetratricopeptide (TPR) repeat protein